MNCNKTIAAWALGVILLGWTLPESGAADGPDKPPQKPLETTDAERDRAQDKDRRKDNFHPKKGPPHHHSSEKHKEWKELSPEERRAKIEDYRKKHGSHMYSREEIDRRRKEFKALSPEEQRAKIREWREKHGGLKYRFNEELNGLREKKKQGTLTEEDAKRLERMEVLARRFEKSGPRSRDSERGRSRGRPPHHRPPPPNGSPKC